MSREDDLHRLGLKLKFAYSLIGLMVGLVCIIVGMVLGLAGVVGHTTWTASLFGLSTNLNDAAPGVIVFIVGIFFVLITKFKVKDSIKSDDRKLIYMMDEPTLNDNDHKSENNPELTEYALEAIRPYDDLITRFETATELPLREQVAKALLNKGITLGELGCKIPTIEVYDDLIARFGTATELPLREQVAKALLNKGKILAEPGLSNPAGAIEVYDDLIARFDTATELQLREQVAKALLNKGNAIVDLGELGVFYNFDSNSAIKAYDQLIARFETATELPLREQIAKALLNKGTLLGESGSKLVAMEAYNDLIDRFGNAAEHQLRAQVADAEIRKSNLQNS